MEQETLRGDVRPSEVTSPEIRTWMVDYVARLLGIEQRAVQTDKFFNEIGLDSMMVIVMTEELGKRLGREIEPTLAYDHPTIDRFAAYLDGTAG